MLVDKFFRKSWVILLKFNSDVDARLKEWKALVEAESGEKLLRFRTDNGVGIQVGQSHGVAEAEVEKANFTRERG